MKNVGRTDSIIRIILAVILIYFIDGQSHGVQIALSVIAMALVFTALNGFCLLYKLFSFSTRKKSNKA